jgi:hypothetical protein
VTGANLVTHSRQMIMIMIIIHHHHHHHHPGRTATVGAPPLRPPPAPSPHGVMTPLLGLDPRVASPSGSASRRLNCHGPKNVAAYHSRFDSDGASVEKSSFRSLSSTQTHDPEAPLHSLGIGHRSVFETDLADKALGVCGLARDGQVSKEAKSTGRWGYGLMHTLYMTWCRIQKLCLQGGKEGQMTEPNLSDEALGVCGLARDGQVSKEAVPVLQQQQQQPPVLF